MSSLRVKSRQKKQAKKAQIDINVDAQFLGSLSLFSDVDEYTLNKIASRFQRLALKRDQVLYQGPPLDEQFSPVYIVLSGDLAIYRYLGIGD
jgi:hypothetical protein